MALARLMATRGLMMQRRFMNLQEYQSKGILMEHGCSVQRFVVCDSLTDAKKKLQDFDLHEYVVKAQVLAGGRGKGRFLGGPPKLGGVHISYKKEDALWAVGEMIGKRLVTKQTTSDGVLVEKVMIADGVSIARETYLAILLCRQSNGVVIVASPAGGVDIEQVAEATPELIFKEPVNITDGLSDELALQLARKLRFKESLEKVAAEEIKRLYNLFLQVDATQIEINPLVETADGRVFCVDAKMNFDDSAAFRQKKIFELEDKTEQDPRELEAHKYKLNYVGMDGNIACLVNGAGLAMATMDLIKFCGGEPANFLDVGGGVTEEQVLNAFKILTADAKVRCVLVNIFGGIVNCATIANGIIEACRKSALTVPLVVRLEGTNVTEGRRLLHESGLPIINACGLDDAATKAVQALKRG